MEPFVGILDQLSSAVAAAAFNLNLRMSSGYAGPLFRVRNDAAAAETDIHPREDGQVDLAALEDACSVAGGFVDCFLVTAYDQSGHGNDLTQATASQQPVISDVGGLITDGATSLLAAQWDGVDDRLARADTCGLSGDCAVGISILLSEEVDAESFPAMIGTIAVGRAFGLSRNLGSGLPARHRASVVDRFREYGTSGAYVSVGSYQHNDVRRAVGTPIHDVPFYVNGEALTPGAGTDTTLLDMGTAATAWGDVPEAFETFRAHIRSGCLVIWSAPTEGADKVAFDAWMAEQI